MWVYLLQHGQSVGNYATGEHPGTPLSPAAPFLQLPPSQQPLMPMVPQLEVVSAFQGLGIRVGLTMGDNVVKGHVEGYRSRGQTTFQPQPIPDCCVFLGWFSSLSGLPVQEGLLRCYVRDPACWRGNFVTASASPELRGPRSFPRATSATSSASSSPMYNVFQSLARQGHGGQSLKPTSAASA